MDEPYIPKVNDYVVWDKGEYGKDEGWGYFFCEEYITIETGVRPKPVSYTHLTLPTICSV